MTKRRVPNHRMNGIQSLAIFDFLRKVYDTEAGEYRINEATGRRWTDVQVAAAQPFECHHAHISPRRVMAHGIFERSKTRAAAMSNGDDAAVSVAANGGGEGAVESEVNEGRLAELERHIGWLMQRMAHLEKEWGMPAIELPEPQL